MLKGIKEGGTLLLNSLWDEAETVKRIPDNVKAIIGKKHIKLYIINATKIAGEIGLGNRTNTILQSAFFKITGIIPYEDAVKYMKDAIVKSYGKKGENVVNMNYAAVDRGGEYTEVKIPAEWAKLTAKFENSQQGPPRSRVRKEDCRRCERPGRRRPACQRIPSLCRRYDACRHIRLREERCRSQGSCMETRELYPVQHLRIRLPSRCHPSVPPHRGRGREGSRRRSRWPRARLSSRNTSSPSPPPWTTVPVAATAWMSAPQRRRPSPWSPPSISIRSRRTSTGSTPRSATRRMSSTRPPT